MLAPRISGRTEYPNWKDRGGSGAQERLNPGTQMLLTFLILITTWYLHYDCALSLVISSFSGKHGHHPLLNFTSCNHCSPVRLPGPLSLCPGLGPKKGFLVVQRGSRVFPWTSQSRQGWWALVPLPALTLTLTVLWLTYLLSFRLSRKFYKNR